MRFYYSTIPHDPPRSFGDCFRACVATVLEVRSSLVPHFLDDPNIDWWVRMVDWCERIGLQPITVPDDMSHAVTGYAVALGGRPEHGHAVVVKDGILVHDPDGRMQKVFDKWEAVCFVVSDVGKFVEWKRCS